MRPLIALFLASFSACICGHEFLRPHISDIGGGEAAEPHEFPWMIIRLALGKKCGSFLIHVPGNKVSSDMVLTAAHCLKKPNDMTFYAGIHFVNETSTMEGIRASHAAAYPSYEANRTWYDIGIVKLSKPLVFSDTIRPILLPRADEILEVGDQCVLAGWGWTAENVSAEMLRRLNVTISVPLASNVANVYTAYGTKGDKTLQPSACPGDSGSPLVCKNDDGEWVAHGITSSSGPCDAPSQGRLLPTRFVKIVPFLDWINEKIREWSSVLP